ncbi:MAG: hypothetical protein ACKN9U_09870 [Pirellulaceae bacterium]
MKKFVALMLCAVAIAGCGGQGGSTTPVAPDVVPPKPGADSTTTTTGADGETSTAGNSTTKAELQ